ncbi:DUF2795 domain-containing protein [Aquipuribacter hungaricus]|uniref:DUF2795 domain-containing protein n=1 Tax=Aquipuribacter hungaricus TaxID=545624 RepID=A0ABV7WF93_9MICO
MTESTDDIRPSRTDIEGRSEIARFLGTGVWPADRDALVATAAENDATDRVLSQLGSLPEGRTFTNVQDVAVELGLAEPEPEGAGSD